VRERVSTVRLNSPLSDSWSGMPPPNLLQFPRRKCY